MYKFLLLISFALLTSCSLSHIDSDLELTQEQKEELSAKGTSTVSGQVLLIKEEGQRILFGKNTEVLLVPVCESSTDIISQVYGTNTSGTRPMEEHPRFNWGELSKYNKLMRTNNRGSFTFRNLPSGSYYVLSFISIPDKKEDIGASVMRRISVDEGKVKMVSLRL